LPVDPSPAKAVNENKGRSVVRPLGVVDGYLSSGELFLNEVGHGRTISVLRDQFVDRSDEIVVPGNVG
jgi:hypothetical protein